MSIENHIEAKLSAYAEVVNKPKLEAMFDALSLAMEVRRANIELKKILQQIERENQIYMAGLFRKIQKRETQKSYYHQHSRYINQNNIDNRKKRNSK